MNTTNKQPEVRGENVQPQDPLFIGVEALTPAARNQVVATLSDRQEMMEAHLRRVVTGPENDQ